MAGVLAVFAAFDALGAAVFARDCFSCHNTPNVFGNRDGALALGPDGLNPEFPSHAPAVGRTFNVGVSERNAHNLEFTRWTGTAFEPIVLPMVYDVDGDDQLEIVGGNIVWNADGSVVWEDPALVDGFIAVADFYGDDVIAEATMIHVCVDSTTFEKREWPDWFRDEFAAVG